METNQLTFEHICFKYKGNDNQLFTDLDVTMETGQVVGILGASGSGKTTLTEILLGQLKPTCQQFRILENGKPVTAGSRSWSYVPQQNLLREYLKVSETFGADAFDKVLVDAPCSGIGLIRRKPDIKYNKDNVDFASLQAVQLEILDGVCQSVRKDGIIVYSTCTIIGEENFDVVDQFLKTHPNFELVPLDHERKDILKDGCILITPELYGSDGFFISRFRRIS